MRRALAALAAALLSVPLLPASPGRAQTPPPAGTLRLASQTAWVAPGGELNLRVTATAAAPAADVELSIAVYRQVGSRSEFLTTLDDRLRGGPITTVATPLSELATDAGGAYVVRLPVQDPAQPVDRARIRLRDEGVYPVRVELREAGGGRSLARFVTHLLYVTPPKEGGVPLGFSVVLPFSAPPAVQPDGGRALDPAAAARLSTLAAALEAHPNVPLNVQPTPETLEALSLSERVADRDTLAGLKRAVTDRQVLGGPYVAVQPGAFGAAGGEPELISQLDRGAEVLNELLDVRPDPRTWVTDERLDEAAVERLRSQQVDRLVLPEAAFAPAGLPVTLTQPFEVQSRSVRRPTAAAGDAALEAYFNPRTNEPDDAVLRAHNLLADLAVLYFDRPGRPRAVVAQVRRDWAVDRAFLDALLTGLTTSPVVKGVTLDDLFASVPPATGARNTALTRRLAANPPPPELPLGAVRATRNRLEAFASMLDADNPLDDQLEAVLLAAQSADLRGRQRTNYLGGVDRRIDAELGKLAIPNRRTITLTARRGEIPVSIQWTGDYPIQLNVRAGSDRLSFPNHDPVRSLSLTRRNTTERFVVQARSSGDFPLRISLESPEGGLVIAQSRFTVRSTAASGVGIGLSVGAGLILAWWWARHLLRGRRNRRLVPA